MIAKMQELVRLGVLAEFTSEEDHEFISNVLEMEKIR